MTLRQHAPLILVGDGIAARQLDPVPLQGAKGTSGYDEAWLRDLMFAHPGALPVAEHLKLHAPDLDEVVFVDGIGRNLAQGRFLLLILGDGIREGVEAIADYVQEQAGLQFTLGLVETQVFELGDGRRIVQPRILARTLIVNRTVVELRSPEIAIVDAGDIEQSSSSYKRELNEREIWMREFWTEFLSGLRLDDADQALANVVADSSIIFSLPAKAEMWMTCFFRGRTEIGARLVTVKNAPKSQAISNRLNEQKDEILNLFSFPVTWNADDTGKLFVEATQYFPDTRDHAVRQDEFAWFRVTINAFVNAFRPRIVAIMRDLADGNH